MATRLAVVIPAYRPSAGLLELVRNLTTRELPAIIVVDDGSGAEFREVFDRVAELPRVRLVRHAVNLGKGAALKTAFNYVLCEFPELIGVVTADADGQHDPDDIERVARRLEERPDALVLGAREFGGDVPLRSKIGNVATRALVRALLGQRIADTQTGLRGIPATLLPRLLRLEATGYEFELEMLIAAHHLAIPIVEQTIRTIYERGNPTSHFNPLIDSMKIYFVLLRFGSVSLLSALLDNLIFILTVHRLDSVLEAQVIGRAFSVAFNYVMVRSSVFYSHQKHKSTLPKYLALTVASGTCAYGGIELLSTRFGVGVVPAKLLVETFLFFVNFAVQRAFIFKPPAAEREREPRRPVPPMAWVLAAALAAAVGLELYGFRTHNLFGQDIWYPVGLLRFERFAEAFAILSAALILLVPRYFAATVGGLLIVLTAVSVGPVPVLAVSFFFLSANALGSIVLRGAKTDSAADQVCVTLLGVGIYTFLMTFLARTPINYPATWGAILAAPVLLNFGGVRARLATWRTMVTAARRPGRVEAAALAVLLLFVTAQWVVNLKPETTADGLAMHLAIPMNIAMHHRMTIEPARFVWAVMPMAADFSYSIVYLLGGEYAARLIVFTMLLGVCVLLCAALRRWTTPALAYLLAAAFVATPIVQLVTGALFVENFLAAMVLGTLTAIWRLGDTGERRYFYLAMALGGATMSVKFGALAFVLIAVPFAFAEARRHRKTFGPRPGAAFAAGAVLLVAMAAPPYAVAYAKTGNPLFPFLNEKFHSPLFPAGVDIRDARFRKILTWRTPYLMTFQTQGYYEGQGGSLGFHWLAVVPLGLLGFAAVRRRPAVSAAVVAFGAGAVILSTEPNARYLYAAMPLSLIPVGSALAWLRGNQRVIYWSAATTLLAATALNAYFLPSASYYHKDFAIQQPFSRAARVRYVAENAAIRNVVAYFDKAHPGAGVLLTHEGSNAGIDGDVYENHWHQIANYLRIREAADVPALVRLLRSWKVEYFIGLKPAPGQFAEPQMLADMLAACTLPEFEAGDYYLARLVPACNAQSIAAPVITVPPGFYDAYDPALAFRGAWSKAATPGADRDTSARAIATGSAVSLAFEGRAVYFVYGVSPDGGIAQVTIDGRPPEKVDQYAPVVRWQHKAGYCCFGPGRHVITIESSGEKNAASKGYALNLDSVSVVD